MTIKAVFRVQCDGPCKGWLSLPRLGLDVPAEDMIVRHTAVTAGLWSGERAARRAALGNGWLLRGAGDEKGQWLCPPCYDLVRIDIRIPKAAPCLGTHDTWAVCKECA